MKLALIDVETTGCNPREDRVIDIGIVLVDGDKIISEWESLVNPGITINPFITGLTGISNEDVASAPSFMDISHELTNLLSGRIFVAHNAGFDYSFIKHEYLRIDQPFKATRLCTVKLSRSLFPKARHHNLDALIERFHLEIKNRHRALPDAKIIFSFLQKFQLLHGKDTVENKINEISKKPVQPPNVSSSLITSLSNSVGVYIFYNDQGAPLYIGKSIHIKDRVLQHFYSDTQSAREMHINRDIKHIETQIVSGELEALLTESRLIKSLVPIYNRRLRLTNTYWILYKYEDENGYYRLKVTEQEHIPYNDHENSVLIARSKRQIVNVLKENVDNYKLCPKLCGLEMGDGVCFSYQLESCNGACKGLESSHNYNNRLITAFSGSGIPDWPYDGPIIIPERNDSMDMESFHLVMNWSIIKTAKTLIDLEETEIPKDININYDEFLILRKYLSKNPNNYLKIDA